MVKNAQSDKVHRLSVIDMFAGLTITIIVAYSLYLLFARHPTAIPRKHQVIVEISSLESGLTEFKSNYGKYPPSKLNLYTTPSGWESDHKSRELIQSLWPKFDFDSCGGLNDRHVEVICLNGPECLVFFLGGVFDSKSGTCVGFSTNESQPFQMTGERKRCHFEFQSNTLPRPLNSQGRLVDVDSDGFPEYVDPFPNQTHPYLYFSSHNHHEYQSNELQNKVFEVYRKTPIKNADVWNSGKTQIISPGNDGCYGAGGYFNPLKSAKILSGSERKAERDNIANFTLAELSDFTDQAELGALVLSNRARRLTGRRE
ncbi:MAG: hypothetical protein FJ267_11690 [Planctomycetes bacterium]|nr:hypothetical protein [Planctomycetota bacterium]